MSHSKKKLKIVLALGAPLVLCGLLGAYRMETHSGQTTNDAYIGADYTVLAPRVAGQISELLVDDNAQVHAGQLLARIDDRDYVAAVDAARADVAVAQATVASAAAALAQQQSVIAQAQAALSAARAARVFARSDYERYADLARHGAGSVQNAQQARARIDTAAAEVERQEAALQAARQQVNLLQAQRQHADATLQRGNAALESARLSLSWTRIEAPVDGMVGQRSLRVGAYVTPGTPLLAVVPLKQAYVVANFQETQLEGVQAGQGADIRVDTFPDHVLHGTVDSVAPATGVTFAALAPDNATGNFTKVVQRLPVKIRLDPGQPGLDRLRVGMSVEATLHAGEEGGPR